MKWKIKKSVQKESPEVKKIIGRKGPEIGDIKNVKHFALYPKKIDNYNVWLESYIEVLEYRKYYDRVNYPWDGIVYEDGGPIYKCRLRGYNTKLEERFGWRHKEFKINITINNL